MRNSFVTQWLKGEAHASELYEYFEKWMFDKSNPEPLYQYLGFTRADFVRYTEDRSWLEKIMETYRPKKPGDGLNDIPETTVKRLSQLTSAIEKAVEFDRPLTEAEVRTAIKWDKSCESITDDDF